MADPNYTVEEWRDGVLVDSQTFTKPPVVYNREVLVEKAVDALAANKAYADTPSGSITSAMAVAQSKDLSRQVNALIRLLLDLLDDITDA